MRLIRQKNLAGLLAGSILVCASKGFAEVLAPAGAPSDTVFSVEANYTLWALVRLESQRSVIQYPFNRRRGDFAGRNLRAMNATALDLTGFNFRNCDLRGADFSNSVLTRTDFSNADLSQALFSSAKDRGAYFNRDTKLPFSREMAAKRGWIETSK